MDIQLLMRIARMAPPRWLSLSADVAGGKRLVACGMIRATLEPHGKARGLAHDGLRVDAITEAGAEAIATETSRARIG